MIRPQVSNAVVLSILFSVLAGGGMLLVSGAPVVRHAAAAVERCDLPTALFGNAFAPQGAR